jgi:hypothetical protein
MHIKSKTQNSIAMFFPKNLIPSRDSNPGTDNSCNSYPPAQMMSHHIEFSDNSETPKFKQPVTFFLKKPVRILSDDPNAPEWRRCH